MKSLSCPVLKVFFTATLALAISTASHAQSTTRPAFVDGSTNVGNAGNSSSRYSEIPPERVVRWCGDRLSSVRSILNDAAMAKLSGASREEVAGIYEKGLQSLAEDQTDMDSAYSLTHRAIIRGVRLSKALSESLNSTEVDFSTRIHFLENYYTFIQEVAANLDIPYYIPYYNRGNCHDCDPRLSEEIFSQKLLEMARSQLNLVLDTLATKTKDEVVFPKGNPQGFLIALEFISHDAAVDLDSSLVGARMACVISDLSALNAKLASYNGGNRSVYRNREDWAVRFSYDMASDANAEIAKALSNIRDYGCQSAPPPYVTHRESDGYPVPRFVTPRK